MSNIKETLDQKTREYHIFFLIIVFFFLTIYGIYSIFTENILNAILSSLTANSLVLLIAMLLVDQAKEKKEIKQE